MTGLLTPLQSGRGRGNDLLAPRMICFAVAAAAACVFARSVSASSAALNPLLDAFALAAVAIAMWHGAYDGVLAQPIFKPRLGKWWAPAFGTGYLLLTGAILVAWHFVPRCALASFLAYSSWHYGTEQDVEPLNPATSVAAFSLGALPIAAACRWHPDPVSGIFRFMLGSAAGSSFAQRLTHASGGLLWWLVVLALMPSLVLPAPSRGARLSQIGLVALVLLLFRCCDPLFAFAIYFCLWHTPEHLVSSSTDRAGRYAPQIMMRNLRAGMLSWLASLAGLAALLALRPGSLNGYASAVFILLSALTVPHMMLNEFRRLR